MLNFTMDPWFVSHTISAAGTNLEAPEYAAGSFKVDAYAAFLGLHLTPRSRHVHCPRTESQN
jgi:hypothetical protein